MLAACCLGLHIFNLPSLTDIKRYVYGYTSRHSQQQGGILSRGIVSEIDPFKFKINTAFCEVGSKRLPYYLRISAILMTNRNKRVTVDTNNVEVEEVRNINMKNQDFLLEMYS